MNLGLGDIAAGVRLALQIYDKGFVDENSADVRYANFKNDINNFRYLLDKLVEALKAAQERYQSRGPAFGSRPHEPLCKELEKERRVIIGDFCATLRECEKLLDKNRELRRRHSNVLENLKYHLTQQEQHVDDLRRRLYFHSEKIRFVLDRLSIRLLTDLDAKIDDLRAIADENLQLSQATLAEVRQFRYSLFGYLSGGTNPPPSPTADCHIASDHLAAIFWTNLYIDAPPTIESGVPIVEGFDALLSFFEQSAEGSDHTPEKYLLFLKSRWLYERLVDSKEYAQARPGFYYKRAINQIGTAIAAKTNQSGQLVHYADDVLTNLPDASFHIWPAPTIVKPIRSDKASLLMERGNEQRIIDIEFPSTGQSEADSITVFRSTQNDFRIVDKTSQQLESGQIVNSIVQQKLNGRKDKLIPRYALPTLLEPSLEMSILSDGEEKLYEFDGMENLLRFQAAVIGYEATYDCDQIQCQFSDTAQSLDCAGRLQIWQEPVVLNYSSEEHSRPEQTSGRKQSSFSQSSHSRYDSLVPSLMSTNTVKETDGGWQGDKLKSSAIIIFTQLTDSRQNHEFAFIFIELSQGISIDPYSCRCSEDYERCSNIILTASKSESFAVRVRKTGHKSDRGVPNPNSFDILPLRLPRDPRFDSMSLLRTQTLVLKFKTLPLKRCFDEQLRAAARTRDVQKNDQKQFQRDVRYHADRPIRIEEHVSGNVNESSGILLPNHKHKPAETSVDEWSALRSETLDSQAMPKKKKSRFGFGKKHEK